MSESNDSENDGVKRSKDKGERSQPSSEELSEDPIEVANSAVNQYFGIGSDPSTNRVNKAAGSESRNISDVLPLDNNVTHKQAVVNIRDESSDRGIPDSSKGLDPKAVRSPMNSRAVSDMSTSRILARTNSERRTELKQRDSSKVSLDPTESVISAVTQYFGIGQDEGPSQKKTGKHVAQEQIVAASHIYERHDNSNANQIQSSGSRVLLSKVSSTAVAKQKSKPVASTSKGEFGSAADTIERVIIDGGGNQKVPSEQSYQRPSKDPTESLVSAVRDTFGMGKQDSHPRAEKTTSGHDNQTLSAEDRRMEGEESVQDEVSNQVSGSKRAATDVLSDSNTAVGAVTKSTHENQSQSSTMNYVKPSTSKPGVQELQEDSPAQDTQLSSSSQYQITDTQQNRGMDTTREDDENRLTNTEFNEATVEEPGMINRQPLSSSAQYQAEQKDNLNVFTRSDEHEVPEFTSPESQETQSKPIAHMDGPSSELVGAGNSNIPPTSTLANKIYSHSNDPVAVIEEIQDDIEPQKRSTSIAESTSKGSNSMDPQRSTRSEHNVLRAVESDIQTADPQSADGRKQPTTNSTALSGLKPPSYTQILSVPIANDENRPVGTEDTTSHAVMVEPTPVAYMAEDSRASRDPVVEMIPTPEVIIIDQDSGKTYLNENVAASEEVKDSRYEGSTSKVLPTSQILAKEAGNIVSDKVHSQNSIAGQYQPATSWDFKDSSNQVGESPTPVATEQSHTHEPTMTPDTGSDKPQSASGNTAETVRAIHPRDEASTSSVPLTPHMITKQSANIVSDVAESQNSVAVPEEDKPIRSWDLKTPSSQPMVKTPSLIATKQSPNVVVADSDEPHSASGNRGETLHDIDPRYKESTASVPHTPQMTTKQSANLMSEARSRTSIGSHGPNKPVGSWELQNSSSQPIANEQLIDLAAGSDKPHSTSGRTNEAQLPTDQKAMANSPIVSVTPTAGIAEEKNTQVALENGNRRSFETEKSEIHPSSAMVPQRHEQVSGNVSGTQQTVNERSGTTSIPKQTASRSSSAISKPSPIVPPAQEDNEGNHSAAASDEPPVQHQQATPTAAEYSQAREFVHEETSPKTAVASSSHENTQSSHVIVHGQVQRSVDTTKSSSTPPLSSEQLGVGTLQTTTDTPPPVPIRGSQTSSLNARHCWICFATDEDELGLSWIQPCKCKGTTKWVHQSCLQMWVDEKLKEHRDKKVACPQCKTEYLIYIPQANILVRCFDQIDNVIYRVCPFVAAGVVIGSFYWNAVTYGAIVMLQVVGSEGASAIAETFQPTVIIVGLPIIPLSLIVFRLFQWEDSFLNILRTTSRCVPLLHYFLPGHEINESGNVTEVPVTTTMSSQRVLAGALLTPMIAKLCGNICFPWITSPLWRTLLGGTVFFSVKGLIKMYHKQQNYKRLSRRRILDNTEENKRLIEQSRPWINQVASTTMGLQFVASVENRRVRHR